MKLNIIKYYIDNTSEEDVKTYLKKEKIHLNNDEFNYLINTIKNNYEKIINNDLNIINDIKNNINKESYIKLQSLYNKYIELIK